MLPSCVTCTHSRLRFVLTIPFALWGAISARLMSSSFIDGAPIDEIWKHNVIRSLFLRMQCLLLSDDWLSWESWNVSSIPALLHNPETPKRKECQNKEFFIALVSHNFGPVLPVQKLQNVKTQIVEHNNRSRRYGRLQSNKWKLSSIPMQSSKWKLSSILCLPNE